MEALSNIGGDFLSLDVIVVVLVLAGVLAFSYTIGKDHGVTLLQSLYLSAFPFFFLPNVVASLPDLGMEPHAINTIYLSGLFVVTAFILMRNGFFESPMVPSKWEIGVFGILFTGLAMAIIGSFMSPEVAEGLSPIVQATFFGDPLLTFWALAPIGFWVLIKGE
jgi:hypothetical protein